MMRSSTNCGSPRQPHSIYNRRRSETLPLRIFRLLQLLPFSLFHDVMHKPPSLSTARARCSATRCLESMDTKCDFIRCSHYFALTSNGYNRSCIIYFSVQLSVPPRGRNKSVWLGRWLSCCTLMSLPLQFHPTCAFTQYSLVLASSIQHSELRITDSNTTCTYPVGRLSKRCLVRRPEG